MPVGEINTMSPFGHAGTLDGYDGLHGHTDASVVM